MSTELFERVVRVEVGSNRGGGVRIFEGFRTTFSVGKTGKKSPNKAKVELYNLSRDEAAFIESRERGKKLSVFAGYGEDVGKIFQGDIRRGKAKTTTNGPDRVTRIEAAASGSLYRSARVNKVWRGGVKTSDVVREIGHSFGFSNLRLPPGVEDTDLVEGFTVSGPSRDILDTLAASLNFEWFFEDDELRLTAKGRDTGEQAVVLSAETGLLESIEITNKGVNGVCLLNYRIRPKRILQIDTPQVQGFFMARKVSHKGDSGFSRAFYTEFTAVARSAGARRAVARV